MTGRVVIAGLGPGAEALVTPEVSAALAAATDVVGYIPYVARVVPRPGCGALLRVGSPLPALGPPGRGTSLASESWLFEDPSRPLTICNHEYFF